MIYHLCLGSNLDNPDIQISKAIEALAEDQDIRIIRFSSRIRTQPYGRITQPDFINQIVEVESALNPGDLLARLLEIETKLGRVRTEKWAPRIIDIDILLAENTTLDTRQAGSEHLVPQVTIPHPDFHNRRFCLQLLNELIPEAQHPVLHKTISELYYKLLYPGGKP